MRKRTEKLGSMAIDSEHDTTGLPAGFVWSHPETTRVPDRIRYEHATIELRRVKALPYYKAPPPKKPEDQTYKGLWSYYQDRWWFWSNGDWHTKWQLYEHGINVGHAWWSWTEWSTQ